MGSSMPIFSLCPAVQREVLATFNNPPNWRNKLHHRRHQNPTHRWNRGMRPPWHHSTLHLAISTLGCPPCHHALSIEHPANIGVEAPTAHYDASAEFMGIGVSLHPTFGIWPANPIFLPFHARCQPGSQQTLQTLEYTLTQRLVKARNSFEQFPFSFPDGRCQRWRTAADQLPDQPRRPHWHWCLRPWTPRLDPWVACWLCRHLFEGLSWKQICIEIDHFAQDWIVSLVEGPLKDLIQQILDDCVPSFPPAAALIWAEHLMAQLRVKSRITWHPKKSFWWAFSTKLNDITFALRLGEEDMHIQSHRV